MLAWENIARMAFVIVALLGMYVARRISWALAREMYSLPRVVIFLLSLLWGLLVAYLIHLNIMWQHPYWVLKWIFGFVLGAYSSMPAYGLWSANSTPPGLEVEDMLMTLPPFAVYVMASVVLAFWFS